MKVPYPRVWVFLDCSPAMCDNENFSRAGDVLEGSPPFPTGKKTMKTKAPPTPPLSLNDPTHQLRERRSERVGRFCRVYLCVCIAIVHLIARCGGMGPLTNCLRPYTSPPQNSLPRRDQRNRCLRPPGRPGIRTFYLFCCPQADLPPSRLPTSCPPYAKPKAIRGFLYPIRARAICPRFLRASVFSR